MTKRMEQIMEPVSLAVTPDTPVAEFAKRLLAEQADGACVLDAAGRLVGVVTAMDVVFQQKRVHLPTMFVFLEALLPLGDPRTEAELRKISGASVEEIMTRDPVTVDLDTALDEAASLMVERHLSLLPVLDEHRRLVGVLTKRAILRAAAGEQVVTTPAT